MSTEGAAPEPGFRSIGSSFLPEGSDVKSDASLSLRESLYWSVASLVLSTTKLDEFQAETKVLAELKHPNVVQYFGIFNDNSTYYIVMEFSEKGSLDLFVRNSDDKITTAMLVN